MKSRTGRSLGHLVFAGFVILAMLSATPATTAPPETDESGASEAEETNGQSDSGIDTAWNQYQQAFQRLAAGEPERAAEKLVRLREDHPEHTAAVFSRPVLESLRKRPDVGDDVVPSASSRPPIEEHPAVKDEDSSVYDPDWVRFREAFVALANGETDEARTKLESLTDGDHPTAGLAAPLLDSLSSSDGSEKTADSSSDDTQKTADSSSDGSEKTADSSSDGSEKTADSSSDGSEKTADSSSDGSEKTADSSSDGSEETEKERTEGSNKPSAGDESEGESGEDDFGSTALRIFGSTTGATGGYIAGGILGGGLGFVVAIPIAVAAGPRLAIPAFYAVTALGVGVGAVSIAPLGAYIGGNLAHGHGGLLGTYIGGITGTAVALGLFSIPNLPPALLVPQLLLPIIGSVAGYEVSHAIWKPDGLAKAPTVRPMLSVGRGARREVNVGLNIRF